MTMRATVAVRRGYGVSSSLRNPTSQAIELLKSGRASSYGTVRNCPARCGPMRMRLAHPGGRSQHAVRWAPSWVCPLSRARSTGRPTGRRTRSQGAPGWAESTEVSVATVTFDVPEGALCTSLVGDGACERAARGGCLALVLAGRNLAINRRRDSRCRPRGVHRRTRSRAHPTRLYDQFVARRRR